MTLFDLLLITAVMLGFVALRFGVPILFMWMLSRALGFLARPVS